MTESLKHNPDDFGGFQTRRLTPDEAKERLCARRWCHDRGRIQVQIPFEDPPVYQIFCARHFILMMIVASAAMGDPSPIGEGKRIAEALGVDAPIPSIAIPQLIDPEQFCCARCGKGMISEPIGIYAGIRWIHTCEENGEEVEDGG